MKTIKKKKKLSIMKTTIASLGVHKLMEVKGGGVGVSFPTTGNTGQTCADSICPPTSVC